MVPEGGRGKTQHGADIYELRTNVTEDKLMHEPSRFLLSPKVLFARVASA